MIIKIFVNKKHYRMLIDTGSSLNILNKNILKELKPKVSYPPRNKLIVMANGSSSKIHKDVNLNFTINGHQFSTSMSALNCGRLDGILGKPFLEKYNAIIETATSTLYLVNKKSLQIKNSTRKVGKSTKKQSIILSADIESTPVDLGKAKNKCNSSCSESQLTGITANARQGVTRETTIVQSETDGSLTPHISFNENLPEKKMRIPQTPPKTNISVTKSNTHTSTNVLNGTHRTGDENVNNTTRNNAAQTNIQEPTITVTPPSTIGTQTSFSPNKQLTHNRRSEVSTQTPANPTTEQNKKEQIFIHGRKRHKSSSDRQRNWSTANRQTGNGVNKKIWTLLLWALIVAESQIGPSLERLYNHNVEEHTLQPIPTIFCSTHFQTPNIKTKTTIHDFTSAASFANIQCSSTCCSTKDSKKILSINFVHIFWIDL